MEGEGQFLPFSLPRSGPPHVIAQGSLSHRSSISWRLECCSGRGKVGKFHFTGIKLHLDPFRQGDKDGQVAARYFGHHIAICFGFTKILKCREQLYSMGLTP